MGFINTFNNLQRPVVLEPNKKLKQKVALLKDY